MMNKNLFRLSVFRVILKRLMFLFIISFSVFFPGYGCASEVEYNLETARDYLSSRSYIAIVIKLSGGIWFRQYQKYISEYDGAARSQDKLYEFWEDNINSFETNKLVVLKRFKGNLSDSIDIPANTPGVDSLPLGKPMVMFFDRGSSEYPYILRACGVFGVDQFSSEILRADSAQPLIQHIIDNKLSICLRRRKNL